MTVLGRYALAVALAATVTGVLAPMASAAPSACTFTASTLPLAQGLPGGEVEATDGQGGYAGEGTSWFMGVRTSHAVLWRNGTATDLGVVPGLRTNSVSVTGVNKSGTVIGHAQNTTTYTERAFHSLDGKLERLPEPPGTDSSVASAINDNGDIVGDIGVKHQSGVEIYYVHTAVLWPASAPGTVVKLTSGLPTTGHAKATGIDQDGTVLITYFKSPKEEFSPNKLYLWHNNTTRELALPAGVLTVRGVGIANGRVAGATFKSKYEDDGLAALWDQNGTLTRPVTGSELLSVNRNGQSVGFTTDKTFSYGVWQGTQLVGKLSGSLGLKVSGDDGSIAGWSRTDPNGVDNLPTVWRCG